MVIAWLYRLVEKDVYTHTMYNINAHFRVRLKLSPSLRTVTMHGRRSWLGEQSGGDQLVSRKRWSQMENAPIH